MVKNRLHALPPGVLRFYRVERWLFLLTSLLWLLPIWTNTYFVTQFGPGYVYNSRLLHNLLGKAPAFSQFFFINAQADPNWFSTIALAVLQMIFGPVTAEKIFVSACILGCIWLFRWFIARIHKGEKFLAWLAMPFAFHLVLAMGSYNFSWSLVLFLYILRFWYKFRRRFNGDRMFRLMLLLVLSYFMHPAGFLLTLTGLAVISVFSSFRYWPNTPKRNKLLFQDSAVKLMVLLVAALPSLALFIDFLVRYNRYQPLVSVPDTDVGTRVQNLLQISVIQIFDPQERIAAIVLAVFIIVYALYAFRYAITHRRTLSHNMFLFAGAVALALYLFVSQNKDGAVLLDLRLQIFPWFFLIIWLAEERYPVPMKTAGVIAGMVISCWLIFLRMPYYRQTDALAQKYHELWTHITPGSTVLSLGYRQSEMLPGGTAIPDRFVLMPPALPSRDKKAVLLNNFDAAFPYYPINWQPTYNPYKHFNNETSDNLGARIDPVEYERTTGRKVDYIILYAPDRAQAQSGENQLSEANFALKHASSDSLLRLYVHK